MNSERRKIVGLTAGALAAGTLAGVLKASTTGQAAETEPRTSRPDGRALDTEAYHAARRYVRLSVGNVAYVERGRGEAALFLHGFPLNGFQWRGALERLSSHHRCIAPDFLGLGFTQVADGASAAPDAQVAMVVGLLDALGIAAADVVANDSGAAIAQLLAVHHPARVRTMLLTNGDVEPDCPPAALLPVIELAKRGAFATEWLVPWVADKTLARSPQGLGGLAFTNPANLSDDAIDYYLAPLVASARRRAQMDAFAAALEHNSLAGIEPALRRSTIPTRIVWGTGDDVFSPRSPAYLDGILGHSRGVRLVPGAKLFFPEEFPDLIAEEARALWSVG